MTKRDPPVPASAPSAQMALFTLADGATLEVHVPSAIAVEGRPSTATTPGFILRRGKRIVNVGPLVTMFYESS